LQIVSIVADSQSVEIVKAIDRQGERYLFIYLSSYLDQDTAPATYYNLSNHSKVKAIQLNALPENTTSELTGLSSHYPIKVALNPNF